MNTEQKQARVRIFAALALYAAALAADGDALGRDARYAAVRLEVRKLRRDAHQLADGAARAIHGDVLKQLADLIEQHHRRRLGILPDGERRDGRERHQKALVERLAVAQVLPRLA